MSSPTLLWPRYIFGINTAVSRNGSFGDENRAIYIAGQSIVSYDCKTKRQGFAQADMFETITSYAAGNTNKYIAVAERGDKPTIHIIDLINLKRKKSLILSEGLKSKEYVSMNFNADDSLLLTMGGSPDWTLVCWDWTKAKAIATISINTPIFQCIFNPVDMCMVSVIGKECVKFFKLTEKDFRAMESPTLKEPSIQSSCWLRYPEDTLVAGTDDGQILIFQNGDYHGILEASPGAEISVTSMTSMIGGFVIGSKKGTMIIYHYQEVKGRGIVGQFAQVITLQHEMCTGHILHLFLDTNEENLGIVTSDGQLLNLSIGSTSQISTENLSYMVTPFHGAKSITGMDVCVRKPLIITCSKDNTLRLWNFQNHELDFQKTFTEEMSSVALHPNGLHCAIGFVDKLRLYHVLVDDIRQCVEFSIKSCRECKFNRSGNYLAATSGNSILVYSFITGEKVADLRGHNSKVRSITWLDTGSHLTSCGQDGAVYLWDIEESKRVAEYIQKGTTYVSVVNSPEAVFVVGSDKILRQLSFPDFNPVRGQESNSLLTNITISSNKSALFAGTGEYGRPGNIRCYNYPLNGEFDEYPCLSSQILKMRLTPDENFLITADDMGCIVVYELKNRQDRFKRGIGGNSDGALFANRELITLDSWCDDILVTRNDLEDCANAVTELKAKADELKLHNEYQLKLKDMMYSDKLKEANEQFVQELEQKRTAYDLLKEDRTDIETEYSEKIKQAEEEHLYRTQEIETTFQAQIMELVENYQHSVRERDSEIDRLQKQRVRLVESHEKYIEDLVRDYESKIDEERHVRLQLEEQRGDAMKEVEEVQTQFEDDVDTEIENLRRRYDDRLTAARETTLKLKGENGIMKKKKLVYQREIEDEREEIKTLNDKDKEYHAQIDILDKEIKSHKKDIKVRDINIQEKERKIYELKKKNQELDKFKYVLDYKIRELKLQIEPRQVEIVKMKEKISEMDLELEKYHKSNSELDEFIGVLRSRIENIQNEIKEKRQSAVQLENYFGHFRNDLKNVMAEIQNPAQFKKEVEGLISKHGINSGLLKPRLEPEIEQEYKRHKEFLQKSILQLKKDMENSLNTRVEANSQLRKENLELIDEINKNRDSNRGIRNKVQAETGKFRRLAQYAVIENRTKLFEDSSEMKSKEGSELTSQVEANHIDPTEVLERNQRKIVLLQKAIEEMQKKARASSTDRLPPLTAASEGPDVVLPFVTAKIFSNEVAQEDLQSTSLPRITA